MHHPLQEWHKSIWAIYYMSELQKTPHNPNTHTGLHSGKYLNALFKDAFSVTHPNNFQKNTACM